MTKISFVDRLVKSSSTPIHLIRCKDPEGCDCHYFLMCSFEKIKALKAITSGIFDISDYGKIIASGFGRDPSEETIRLLKEKYDFDATTLLN